MRFLREPLVHFLALGTLVFGLYGAFSSDPGAGDPKRITVTQAEIEHLQTLWEKQWQRPPTPEELRTLIDEHIRERILYREALALGLDENDTIVRRRLVQKIEFLIDDAALPGAPAEEELRAHHRDNAERYIEPARISFSHVYFSPDQRGERAETEAQAALETLRRLDSGVSHAREHGDRFLLPSHYEDAPLDAIARDFGKEFATGLAELAPGRWQGPIASGYGVHLVYLEEVEPGRLRSFEEVRRQVENDYLFERRRETREAAYRRIREGYEIVVEGGGSSPKALGS